MIDAKSVVVSVLRVLHDSQVPLEKVVLHKFLYFLDTQGVRIGLRFEPYTYGPFSFDLARLLNDMVFWDELKENKNHYEILDLKDQPRLEAGVEDRINRLLVSFKDVVGEFKFDNLECIGTVLYCAETISFQGDEPTEDSVVKEFKRWKGNRYSVDKIHHAYEKLKPYIKIQ